MGLSERERRDILLSETEDVAREDQIFIKEAVDKAMTLFSATDPQTDPIGYLRIEADLIPDAADKAKVLNEIETLEKLYPPATNKYLAPNGKQSKLNHAQWYAVRTPSFKEYFGDWERLARLENAVSKIDALLAKPKDTSKGIQRESIGPVNQLEIDLVKKELNLDISDYSHTVDRSEINHAKNRHGTQSIEAKLGQIAITDDDFKLIPYVIADPDSIEYSGKNEKGLDAIKYKKAFNGTTIFVEEIRTGKKELAFNTMYKKKTGSGSLQTPSARTSLTTPHLTVQQIIDSYKDVSVIRDPETGEPMPVYHQTNHYFDIFETRRPGAGTRDHETPYGI
jgi:hypothetical protein